MFYFLCIIGFIVFMVWLFFDGARNKARNHADVQREMAEKLTGEHVYSSDEELIAQARMLARQAQALIQAGIVGDTWAVDAINTGSYRGLLPEKRDDGGWLSIYDNLRILKIAGINHREGIERYVGRVECALVPEPDNEFDSDAIKIVAEDRHHLGYIPMGQTDFVCSLTANEFPYRCTAFIEACEDEADGHRFFAGFVYIKRLD